MEPTTDIVPRNCSYSLNN